MTKYNSMKISKKLVQDVHRIVNEGAKPLTSKMEQEIEEMAKACSILDPTCESCQ